MFSLDMAPFTQSNVFEVHHVVEYLHSSFLYVAELMAI